MELNQKAAETALEFGNHSNLKFLIMAIQYLNDLASYAPTYRNSSLCCKKQTMTKWERNSIDETTNWEGNMCIKQIHKATLHSALYSTL